MSSVSLGAEALAAIDRRLYEAINGPLFEPLLEAHNAALAKEGEAALTAKEFADVLREIFTAEAADPALAQKHSEEVRKLSADPKLIAQIKVNMPRLGPDGELMKVN